MSPENPVVSAFCAEPKLTVQRHVYKMALTPDALRTFWDKARKFPTLFTEEIKDDFKLFLGVFLTQHQDGTIEGKGLLWRIDDYTGIFYLTDIDAGSDAEVHVTFFDGRIRGRDALAIEMIRYVMKKYEFRRLTAKVPMYAVPAAHSFIRRIGFKVEGRKRQSCFFKNQWYDTVLYGILADEVK
jgi:RimJ/RimL family protein N-acetyltransferase